MTHRLDHGLDYCIGILWLLNDPHNLRPYHGSPNQMEGDLIMHRLFTQMETGVVFASVHPLSSINITLLVTCTCDVVATIKAFYFSKREIYQSITDIIGCYALACESVEATASSKHFGSPTGLQFGKTQMNRCARNVIWKAFVKRIVHNSTTR